MGYAPLCKLRGVLSHPCDKNNDVARMGHPSCQLSKQLCSLACSQVRFKHLKEFGEPRWVRGPCGSGDQVAIDDRIREIQFYKGTAGELDLGRAGGVGVEFAAFEDAGCGQKLRTVAEGSDRLAGFVKVTNDVQDLRVEAKVLGRASAGNDEAIVGGGIDLIEGGVEGEVVATLFGVGLVAFEIVNGGADMIAFLFAWADGIDGMTHHLQGLEGDHDLVVFDKIAGKEQ